MINDSTDMNPKECLYIIGFMPYISATIRHSTNIAVYVGDISMYNINGHKYYYSSYDNISKIPIFR
jgi:hypothetical protein